MGLRVVTGSVVALHMALLTAACGDTPQPPRPAEPRPSTAEQVEPTPKRESLYDAEGRLKASDEEVVGIRLPVGLTALDHMPRGLHAYRSEAVPAEKLIAYFGPLLFTGEIEQIGGGFVYKRAVPMDQRDSPVPVDVAVTPLSKHRASVKIQEHTQPLPRTPIHELEKILRREKKQLE